MELVLAFALGAVAGAAGTARLRRARPGPGTPLDSLTGLPGRPVVQQRLARLAPGDAVIVLDLDRFKSVNEHGGHSAGDVALRAFAAWLAGAVRSGDTVARWGGDEFVVVVPAAAALSVAERLRAGWDPATVSPPVTVSAGVALHAGGSGGATLAAADAALFAAKRAGRDRTAVAPG